MLPELRDDLFGKNPNRKFFTVSNACLAKCAKQEANVPPVGSDVVSLVALDAPKVAKIAVAWWPHVWRLENRHVKPRRMTHSQS